MHIIFVEFELQTGETIAINLASIMGFMDYFLYAGNNMFNVKHTRLEILELMRKTLQQAAASNRPGIVVPQQNIPDLSKKP